MDIEKVRHRLGHGDLTTTTRYVKILDEEDATAADVMSNLLGELAIACNDANIRKIFEITLLDRIFNIYDTPQAGIAHLQDRTSTNTT